MEFRENRCGENHVLLNDATRVLPVYRVLRPILIQSDSDIHKTLLFDFEFRPNRRIESHALLTGVNNFCPYFLHV